MANVLYSPFEVAIEKSAGDAWAVSAANLSNKYGGLPYMEEFMFLATTIYAFGVPSYVVYLKMKDKTPADTLGGGVKPTKPNTTGPVPRGEEKPVEFKVVK